MSANRSLVMQSLLQEFEYLSTLLAKIPRCIQKGILMCDLVWTCVDVTDDYVVIGTDAGVVHVYSRMQETLVHRLTSQVTVVLQRLSIYSFRCFFWVLIM